MPDNLETNERLAVVETRVDSIDKRLECVDNKVSGMNDKVSDIHSIVVTNKTNMGWIRRLVLILLGLALSSGAFYGYSTLSNGDAVAKRPAIEIENDG